MRFKGVVVEGLAEGAWYVERYNLAFKDRLGMMFFPGTLNLKTDEVVKLQNGIEVKPPQDSLHEVHCYRVLINGEVEGYVVSPMVRRHPPTIVELAAEVNLRERFKLKDGDVVTCELV